MSNISSATTSVQNILDEYGLADTTAPSGSELDRDTFMNLLVTQMQYQDPLQPTSNEEFLAQMAQFSSLEQMENLNTSFAMQQGYDLVGKDVIGSTFNASTGSTNYVTGTVEAITLRNGEVFLSIDGSELSVNDVEMVLNNTSTTDDLAAAIDQINANLATMNEKLQAIQMATEQTAAEQSTSSVETSQDTTAL